MRTHCISRGIVLLAVCLTFALTAGWAAIDRGTVRGTVSDPSGGVVPGVAVVVTNVDTGVQQTTRTNSAGSYFVPELIPGNYKVHFELSGFISTDIDQVEVKADVVSTVDAQLKLGSTSQHVEVSAVAALVDTTASNFGTGIETRYMEDLPIEGRDLQGMVAMIPGLTQSNGPPGTLIGLNGGQFGGFPDPSHILGSQVSLNGAQSSANAWYLDGTLNAAEGVDQAVVDPQPDAVAEFQTITDGFAAEYGRTAGGVFNVVLKSGTNNIHGDLYEYNRNSYFEARNPLAATDAQGRPLPPNYANLNQFGGTVGGPVVIPHVYNGKNKTFFFVAWDISKLVEKAPGALYTVPTAKMQNNDFSEIPDVVQFGLFDPLSTKPLNVNGNPFDRTAFGTPVAGNPNGCLASQIAASHNTSCMYATGIPTNRIDPTAQWFLSQYPAPNYLDPRQQDAATGGCLNTCNNFRAGYSSNQSTNNATVKIDHQITDKHKFFGEWLYNPTTYRLQSLPWTGATVPLVGFNGAFPWNTGNTIAAIGETAAITPTLVNEVRYMYSRMPNIPLTEPSNLQNTASTLQHLAGLNIREAPPLIPVPLVSVSNLGSFGAPSNNIIQVTQANTLMDNLTKIQGKHTIKVGFMYRSDLTGTVLPSSSNLSFGGLTGNVVTGLGGYGVADFLMGDVAQGSQFRITPSAIGSNHTWSFYGQDDFRITPKLTMNVGLRYDTYGWFDDRWNHVSLFDFNLPNPSDPARNGAIVYSGTPAHPSSRAFPPNRTDFGPRLNFAYSPFGDKKTVIRAGADLVYTNGMTMLNGQGYGSSEDPGFQQFVKWQNDATGQGLTGTGVVPAFILSQGAPDLPPYLDPKANNTQLLGINGGGALTQVKLHRDPNVFFWNFEVERELPGNLAITVGYVGSKGTELIGGQAGFNYVPTSVKLQYKSQLNNRVPMPADLVPWFGSSYFMSQLYMKFPQYTSVQCGGGCGWGGTTNYDGLLVKVEKRFGHGVSFLTSYTWQKTIENEGIGGYFSNTWTGAANWGNGRGREFQLGNLSAVNGYNGAQNPDNWRGDRTLAGDNIPNIFNTAWTYELPVGPGKAFAPHVKGVARQVVAGWKLTGNFNAESGVPLKVSAPSNSLTSRPNLIGNPMAGRSGKSRYQQEQQWLNPNAFEAPFGSDPAAIALATTGTPAQKDAYQTANGAYPFWQFGTAGFRIPSVQSPGYWNVDMALGKDFKVHEAQYFQIRVESYNAFNHQSLGTPNTGWCLPPNPDGSVDAVHELGCQFGRITNVQRDPRAWEFAVKYVF